MDYMLCPWTTFAKCVPLRIYMYYGMRNAQPKQVGFIADFHRRYQLSERDMARSHR